MTTPSIVPNPEGLLEDVSEDQWNRTVSGLTVDAAYAAGLGLLNEAVLVTMIGSLPHRAARIFTGTRVLGRSHQDVLVFVKGDRKRATQAAGEVDVTDALAALDTGVDAANDEPDLGDDLTHSGERAY